MMSATSVDDARARATRVLESLEQSISVYAGAKAAENVQKVGSGWCGHLISVGLSSNNILMSLEEEKLLILLYFSFLRLLSF